MKITELMRDVAHEVIQTGGTDEVNSIVTDSRKEMKPGCLFICFRGLHLDGHKYIGIAAERKAAAVLIDEDQPSYPPDITVIKVEHTRKALGAVVSNFYGRPGSAMRLIGVTGTNGKTSTAYFLETILETAGRKVGVIGTVDTRVGKIPVEIPFDTATTPDTLELIQILARMRELGAEDVVMEISSHALSLYKIEGLTLTVGIFTNLTQDHLDFHGTMENYRAAKARLFEHSLIGVVNADDPAAEYFIREKKLNYITYGLQQDCDLKAVHIEQFEGGSSFEADIDGAAEHFYLPIKGRYNIYNCLAAIGAALALNVPVADIRRGVAHIQGVPGRIQAIPNPFNAHILVDYAHTPDGLVNIINAVREFTQNRVITLFGCGGEKDKGKRPIMGRIAGELSDYCILTSDNPRTEPPGEIIKQVEMGLKETNCAYRVFINRREAIAAGVKMLAEGDALIIAGKGHEDYQIIGTEKIPFDDCEEARKAICQCD
jgi:UDP-N-acetylmuramoyl-L-alanyl-D-glutamate--2,6-diaminopimelate ligase